MHTTLTVDAAGADARLDAWLASQLPDYSRSKLQKLIKAGHVTVNGKHVTPHVALSEGDSVEVKADDVPAADAPLVPRPDIAIEVVHEDADVLVVNKPSGLVVHPAVPGETDTLVNALVARYPEIAAVGDAPDRPGIVHRLDKEASGLLAVARTQEAFEKLKAQFQEHAIHKEYAVLVNCSVPRDEDTISLAIGRSATGKRMAARPDARISQEARHDDDRRAVTHYTVDERFPKATLLTVRTETGRTHQIRAHFHAIGCAVVGDPLYVIETLPRLNAPRLFLHAKTLGFTHPRTGAGVTYRTPLPTELEALLTKLRGR